MKLRILLSYHYYKDVDLDALLEKKFAPHYPEIFLDSGGFSAMTQGATIDMRAYCQFIRRFRHRLTTYAALDEIGNAEKTWRNQQTMEGAGLSPLPVFHTGEDWSYLERYIERYSYIALGGMVPYMRQWKQLMPWLVRAFRMAHGKSVYHGFGCTTWNVISRVPWYSVDSSSWAASFRFGQVNLFDPSCGKWFEARLGDIAGCRKLRRLFESYGYDPDDFGVRARNERRKLAGISALAYIKVENYLRQRHGEIKIPRRLPGPIGVLVYLAQGSDGAGLHDASKAQADIPVRDVHARPDLANRDPDHFKRANNEVHGVKLFLADPHSGAGSAGKDTATAATELARTIDGGGA